jgi:aryl-alcohol dehydrogenase-like predicted oxidoreductase
MQAIAEVRGWSRFVALQVEYSLIERTVERELLPMAKELGLGVIPWSPLGGGVLSGKYSESDRNMKAEESLGDGSRKSEIVTSGALSDRNLSIATVVREIGRELGRPAPQIALAWVLRNHAVSAPITGARTLKQLAENLDALNVELTDQQLNRLNSASSIELGYPHDYLLSLMKSGYMRAAMNLCTKQ